MKITIKDSKGWNILEISHDVMTKMAGRIHKQHFTDRVMSCLIGLRSAMVGGRRGGLVAIVSTKNGRIWLSLFSGEDAHSETVFHLGGKVWESLDAEIRDTAMPGEYSDLYCNVLCRDCNKSWFFCNILEISAWIFRAVLRALPDLESRLWVSSPFTDHLGKLAFDITVEPQSMNAPVDKQIS
ncbi:hypothetical protein E2C01_041776 [Portunus trituberculatus]|uniref:RCHY1 zinc-ribbon domain-containing protein n=1 Tax=Portunus trituberculatus TaxID=210409 RepID=A0A5B7FNF2_PORTR|nr:hypothetical protein [Portunus trituberculatus]